MTENIFRLIEPDKPFLLAADIDGTLLGDEEGERLLFDLVSGHPSGIILAVISGRTLASIGELVDQKHLPRPRFIAGSVGTELRVFDDPASVLPAKYHGRVRSGWDLETVYRLGEGEGIQRQEFSDGQPPFHAGFYWDGRPETLAAFRGRLSALGNCHILPSYDHYIDVLPDGVGKGEVACFLQAELGLDKERVVVAGDSGNDREMFETGFGGIVPVNSLDELKKAASKPGHYHSPQPAARGVIDGLVHFGLIKRDKRL